MGNRKKEINNDLCKLQNIKQALEDLRTFGEESIQTLSWQNREISRNLNTVKFLTEVYGTPSEWRLDKLSDEEYLSFAQPLSNSIMHGTEFISLSDNIKSVRSHLNKFVAVPSGSSTAFTTSVVASTDSFVEVFPADSPEYDRMIDSLNRYLDSIHLNEELEYIKQRLPKLEPDVSKDFDHFLQNYYASTQSNLKYQELIGFRSLFFLKLIDGFADIQYVPQSANEERLTRKSRILFFVSGQRISNDEQLKTLADTATTLWDNLSNQDSTSMSVKMGNVTSNYVSLLFHEAIIVVSSLIQQNAHAWK